MIVFQPRFQLTKRTAQRPNDLSTLINHVMVYWFRWFSTTAQWCKVKQEKRESIWRINLYEMDNDNENDDYSHYKKHKCADLHLFYSKRNESFHLSTKSTKPGTFGILLMIHTINFLDHSSLLFSMFFSFTFNWPPSINKQTRVRRTDWTKWFSATYWAVHRSTKCIYYSLIPW